MSGRKAFVALAVTTALGTLGAAPAAAGSDRDRGRDRYGSVVPCSLASSDRGMALGRWNPIVIANARQLGASRACHRMERSAV